MDSVSFFGLFKFELVWSLWFLRFLVGMLCACSPWVYLFVPLLCFYISLHRRAADACGVFLIHETSCVSCCISPLSLAVGPTQMFCFNPATSSSNLGTCWTCLHDEMEWRLRLNWCRKERLFYVVCMDVKKKSCTLTP